MMAAAINLIPVSLTALRALLAPVVVVLALYHPSGAAFGACLVAAFLSDVFDGIIARRLGIATPNLRRLDSIADSIFYLAAVFAAWHLHPDAILDHAAALAVLAALELARYAYDLRKFGREASYHMWSSKLWGIFLFAGFFALLVLGLSGTAVALAIYVGIVADAEGLAISVILPRWQTDVPSFVHALRLRRLLR
jgi:CDP-diacylglycerol--glycerol-3-phosphate 3-phosphatidyltransferase